jgi:chorismate dehydratase
LPPIADRIKISIVNYTNTLPFRWALHRSELKHKIDLQEDVPSLCARKLKEGIVQLALVPVALLPELNEYHIVTRYCIGANGIVDSVKLYHDVPITEIKDVLLDYQSKSSVNLTRVLFKFFWKKEVKYTDASPGFENKVKGRTAAVVIGDRTFALNGKYKFETDLAEAWKQFTGLPFVFAAWVSNERLPASFISEFEGVLNSGVMHIDDAVKDEYRGTVLSASQITEYLKERIDYNLDQPKLIALEQFLGFLARLRNPDL